MTYAADDFANIKAKWDEIRAETDAAIAGEPKKVADVSAEQVEINHYPAPPNPGWANIYDTAPADYMGFGMPSLKYILTGAND